MMRSRSVMNMALCLIFGLGVICCASMAGRASEPPESATTGSPSADDLPKLVGKPAPDFMVKTLDGRTVSLSDYRGKAVLVNFWATWCGACRLEMPWLAELRSQYASQGFEVLGILTDQASSDKIQQITEKYGVSYPVLMCNHATAQAYGGLPFLPASFYIDRRGRVVAEMAEAGSKADIEKDIRRALHGGHRNGERDRAGVNPALYAPIRNFIFR